MELKLDLSNLTDAKIYKNRLMICDYLETPGLKKTKHMLHNKKTGGRCCLGHMCDAFGVPAVRHRDQVEITYFGEESLIPHDLMEALGMHDHEGGTKYNDQFNVGPKKSFGSLAIWNDTTGVRPAKIAAYLRTVIMGGDNTPWREIKPKFPKKKVS